MTTAIEADDADELLPTAHVSLSGAPDQKEACIEHLPSLIDDNGRVEDREAALEALLAREEQTTTGVGMGIGIPHAKTDAVSRPSLAFARADGGIDFGAMDDKPARLVFTILVPESGAEDHLSILSSLSRALMHDEGREGLSDASSPDAVQSVLREAIA
ncbi:fructose PTS transporter subunit IIA [Halobacteria archaeon AArc-dxtr1]|nr:fructose PTS transporter subunit IIA [Halobacteria archaeon AArc-dxtr1]